LPANPVVAAVGSSGTLIIEPTADPGLVIPTGINEQLSGLTWIDNGVEPPYFLFVGNNGSVLTSQP
jgi:hypothetical protein